MPKRTYLPKLLTTTPTKAVFSVRGRKEPVELFLRTPNQLAITVPFRNSRRTFWATSRSTAKRDADDFTYFRMCSERQRLRLLAARYVKRADDFLDVVRGREAEARESRKFVRMLKRGEL